MDAEYVTQYRRLYEGHWWWRAREAFILDVIERLPSKPTRMAILDVGCGDGLFFDALARFGDVEGVEPESKAVSVDGRWSRQISCQPFDESFDPGHRYSLILMLDVLEHVNDPELLIRRAVELLEPAGSIIVTVPALEVLWTSHDDLNDHVRRYTRASFAKLVNRSGARLVRMSYFYHWLVPVKLAVRGREMLSASRPVNPSIPPSWLNRILHGLSRAEQRTLTRLPMPFGSSLLVVLGRPTPAP